MADAYEEYLYSFSHEKQCVDYLRALGYTVIKPTKHEEES